MLKSKTHCIKYSEMQNLQIMESKGQDTYKLLSFFLSFFFPLLALKENKQKHKKKILSLQDTNRPRGEDTRLLLF